ncbi:hypothetical protein RIF29_21553 [Crotalaria pallida]|uniref:RNA helicase n=1 Tax=Crotalaria pallida TaxID=3830 RepID=A0AAN9F380_CROPI
MIKQNPVTLIVGETGCGKSSQVPQFLLEEHMSPILCTQPRRFAVVAVAKMVATARNCELGGEVGYHIGHSKNFSEGSKIVFKTAGVFLDELRDKGFEELKYKAIILDEVHERSVESDLVLVCVKQFLLMKEDMRVVLMSATADSSKYKDYFEDPGRGLRVEVLEIPSFNQKMVFQRSVSYLDQVAESLEISSEVMHSRYSLGPDPFTANVNIKPGLHDLIHDLVLHIDDNEPDIEKSILVFLPTYSSLKQQWCLLKKLEAKFKVHVLNRSIDTEQALMAMKIWKSKRKVILATNIAESSVTIPNVAFVIDSCRSLQVCWDKFRKKESRKLVWVSKSQAKQREGRTGRTCNGQVYRLVTESFFNNLEDHESPAILKLSLRLQVLSMCCATSEAINDPKVLLQKALDPPNPQVVEDALNFLVQMSALKETHPGGRYEPTFYGQLLASFSLSLLASVLVLKFGESGMLREGILLGVILDMQPLPINNLFEEEELFEKYIYSYFGDQTILAGRKEMELMGNFCAFEFWQHISRDKYRLEHLKQVLNADNVDPSTRPMPKLAEDWCSFHNLSLSSLQQVSDIYDGILDSIHRFRPNFLSSFDGLPSYYDPYELKHECLFKCQLNGHIDVVAADEDALEPSSETKKCGVVPYVTSNNFRSYDVAQKFAATIKEIYACSNQPESVDVANFHVNRHACVYFVRGYCRNGSNCSFSHSFLATRPRCNFIFTLEGCRYGESCFFSHDMDPSTLSFRPNPCLPEDNDINASFLLNLFPKSTNQSILLLDGTGVHFSSLARHYDSTKIISACLSETTIMPDYPDQKTIDKAEQTPIPWKEVKCVLWFPCFHSYGEDLEGQKERLRIFFAYLAIRILADDLSEMQVIITMNNIRFSQLQVEKLGRDSFFILTNSFAFDETSFGALSDRVTIKRSMWVSKSISYVFGMRPHTDKRFVF